MSEYVREQNTRSGIYRKHYDSFGSIGQRPAGQDTHQASRSPTQLVPHQGLQRSPRLGPHGTATIDVFPQQDLEVAQTH